MTTKKVTIKTTCAVCGKRVRHRDGKPVLHQSSQGVICGSSSPGADLATRARYGAGSE